MVRLHPIQQSGGGHAHARPLSAEVPDSKTFPRGSPFTISYVAILSYFWLFVDVLRPMNIYVVIWQSCESEAVVDRAVHSGGGGGSAPPG